MSRFQLNVRNINPWRRRQEVRLMVNNVSNSWCLILNNFYSCNKFCNKILMFTAMTNVQDALPVRSEIQASCLYGQRDHWLLHWQKPKVQFKSVISCENFYYRLIFGFKIHETSSNNYFEKTWFVFFFANMLSTWSQTL